MYYWLFRKLTGMEYPPNGYDFVLFSDRVLGALMQYRERNASIFLLVFNLGFGQAAIGYSHGSRTDGSSGWTLRKRAKLAVDMLTAFTAAPIRLVSGAGIAIGGFGLLFGGITWSAGCSVIYPPRAGHLSWSSLR